MKKASAHYQIPAPTPTPPATRRDAVGKAETVRCTPDRKKSNEATDTPNPSRTCPRCGTEIKKRMSLGWCPQCGYCAALETDAKGSRVSAWLFLLPVALLAVGALALVFYPELSEFLQQMP